MALLPGVLPPSETTWHTAIWLFQIFPLLSAFQWAFPSLQQMGKTSGDSKYNLPGKWAWFVMELPSFTIILYCMFTLPPQLGLGPMPWANWTMAGLFTIHYIYRSILFPILQPSISPMHPLPFVSAVTFNILNGLSFGGWLAGYGPTTVYDWSGRLYYIEVGLVLWGWSLLGNIFHDDDLREIRRSAARMQKEKARKEGKPVEGVEKVYMIPKNGLFHYVLFPHYLCEWCEWAAFWMIGGLGCFPARNFLIADIAVMLPRAIQGHQWYIKKFGKDKVGGRKAIIPGIL